MSFQLKDPDAKLPKFKTRVATAGSLEHKDILEALNQTHTFDLENDTMTVEFMTSWTLPPPSLDDIIQRMPVATIADNSKRDDFVIVLRPYAKVTQSDNALLNAVEAAYTGIWAVLNASPDKNGSLSNLFFHSRTVSTRAPAFRALAFLFCCLSVLFRLIRSDGGSRLWRVCLRVNTDYRRWVSDLRSPPVSG